MLSIPSIRSRRCCQFKLAQRAKWHLPSRRLFCQQAAAQFDPGIALDEHIAAKIGVVPRGGLRSGVEAAASVEFLQARGMFLAPSLKPEVVGDELETSEFADDVEVSIEG